MRHTPTYAVTLCLVASTLAALALPARAEPANAVPTYTAKPNLVRGVGRFWAAGTVTKNAAGQILVGDTLGSDSSDADGDGNVESVWSTGTPLNGADVDLLFSKWAFEENARLRFDACIGVTYVSYQWIALYFSNPAFNGAPGSYAANPPTRGYEIGFLTRWEDPSTVHIWRDSPVTTPIPNSVGLTLGPEGYCAAYELRRKNGRAMAFVNGTKVFDEPAKTTTGSIAVSVRSWEGPIKMWNVRWRSLPAGNTPAMDDAPDVGADTDD
jgi:hypothetical protein